MKTKLLVIFIIVACCSSLALNCWMFSLRTKVGYVRSQDLINQFHGTIEARETFEGRRRQMQANVDSLELLYESLINRYLTSKSQMSLRQQIESEQTNKVNEQKLHQYRALLEDGLEEENNKMMEGVLGQVNSFIEEYARMNNYDIILGTTISGNLLYARDDMDITKDLLEQINLKYSGKLN